MGILLWIIFGALAGWLASIVMKSSQGIFGDIILGILGAVVGGLIMSFFGQAGVTGFNVYSLLVAIIGAVVLIWLGRVFYRT
ncbi:MAG: GlsB/YeaQ/YmgE family stress response membrane protein [Candidatus Levyibacteriota bacterium]